MDSKRRVIVKVLGATPVIPVIGCVRAGQREGAALFPTDVAELEKSIKAGFGGSFLVNAHLQSNGLTYANIEHRGNRYLVTSTDLIDWKIVSSSISV